MLYEIQKTSSFTYQYNKLELRFKRNVDTAIDIVKEYPTDYKNMITHLGNRRDGGLYRIRMPGCYIFYIVPEHNMEEEAVVLTMVNIKKM